MHTTKKIIIRNYKSISLEFISVLFLTKNMLISFKMKMEKLSMFADFYIL